MKYPSRNIFQFFLLFTVSLAFAGCGGKAQYGAGSSGGMAMRSMAFEDSVRSEAAPAMQAMPTSADSGELPAASMPAQENAEQTRKLIKRASLHLRIEDPPAIEKPLADLMEKYNAWPASAGVYENSRDYSIRVPSPSYEAMLVDLAGLGRVLRRTENAEDVTLRYYDLEGRLATKRELLKTYQGYLGRAGNIEEIMTVESRIADLQQEIDWTGTQMRNLVSLIDYSTIDLEVSGPPGTSSYTGPSLVEKLKELFGDFGDTASSAFVVLIGIIIYGVPAAIIVILLFWILFGRIGLLKKLWRLAAGKGKSI